ncbi:MAG: hypothetical protein AAF481_07490 [Acidobacteriota bacterium]
MPLISGSASVTRFSIVHSPEPPDFERAAFHGIAPGSEVRDAVGFVPFELGAPWEVGHRRYAFRVQIDKLRPDPVAVKERLKQLVHVEQEQTGAPFVGPKKRKRLKELAEEELISQARPRSQIIECCMDGPLLYVGTTAKAYLGTVLQLLRQIDVVADYKAPWIDLDEPEVDGEIVETTEPGQSVLGCRFLKAVLGDRDIMVEPEAGYVRLQTREARITLTGAVLNDLRHYVKKDAELLAAKLVAGESAFRFDALSWRIGSLRIETARHEHWTDLLDERLEKVSGVYELLDRKYASLRPRPRRTESVPAEPPTSPAMSDPPPAD